MCGALVHVCFTPDSDHESGHVPMVMSALPPKADMCCAIRDVRFGPIADILLNRRHVKIQPRNDMAELRLSSLTSTRLP
jgi:hypothetical protein